MFIVGFGTPSVLNYFKKRRADREFARRQSRGPLPATYSMHLVAYTEDEELPPLPVTNLKE